MRPYQVYRRFPSFFKTTIGWHCFRSCMFPEGISLYGLCEFVNTSMCVIHFQTPPSLVAPVCMNLGPSRPIHQAQGYNLHTSNSLT